MLKLLRGVRGQFDTLIIPATMNLVTRMPAQFGYLHNDQSRSQSPRISFSQRQNTELWNNQFSELC